MKNKRKKGVKPIKQSIQFSAKNREKTGTIKSPKTLSVKKKRVFWFITFLLPVLLLLLLEIGLRIFNYAGNLDLFIAGPPGYENYLRANPNVARRYFYQEANVPTPPTQLFLKQKPSNGYRIFVIGESSAAGFPYGNNASFPNILGRALSNTFPEKNIEVINVAMAAVNSYTILDLTDEILEKSPDALLIYAGHNEYYGALGVGSVQSLGSSRWLIRSYLKLQSIKTFLLLRDFIGWIRNLLSGSKADPTATLMARIVGEQTIPYGSSLYEDGKNQFKENIEIILQKAADHKVKIVLSELVSNIGDQEPFISIEDGNENSAKSVFNLARKLEANGDFEKAKQNYIRAKDFDALRFRAPEEFNSILKDLAKKYSLPLVPAVSYFEKESSNNIIGNEIILEHLHPNKDGYYLLANAFYETMKKNNMISNDWKRDGISQELNNGYTELDSVHASIVIQHLKGSWPFQPKGLPNRFAQNYQPSNHLEEIAFRILSSDNYNLEAGHMELGKYYEKKSELDKAFSEYNALITSIPHEIEFYQKAATVLITKKEFEKASQLLRKSLKYKGNFFAYKWIGQIALMKENYEEAILYLRKGDLSDIQVVFNLSRAFYYNKQWDKGEEFYIRLQNLAPKSEYLSHLTKLRVLLKK